MKDRQGSILIFTLWVLVILSILSLILSRRAATDVNLAKREREHIKASYLAKAGVFKMLAELANDKNPYDSLNEDWNNSGKDTKKLTLAGDTVVYGASDEMARLNINGAGLKPEHLVELGLDMTLADAIIQYRNKKPNKKFEFIEELFLVEAMTKEDFSLISGFVTIYRENDSKININTASFEVLYAIAGDSAYEVMDYRKAGDAEEGTEDDGIFQNSSDISMIDGLAPSLFTWQSSIFRVWAKALSKEGESALVSVEAVVDRKTGRILHWCEQ